MKETLHTSLRPGGSERISELAVARATSTLCGSLVARRSVETKCGIHAWKALNKSRLSVFIHTSTMSYIYNVIYEITILCMPQNTQALPAADCNNKTT